MAKAVACRSWSANGIRCVERRCRRRGGLGCCGRRAIQQADAAFDQPAIALSSIQDVVEYGESSLSTIEGSTADHGPTRPNDVVSIPTTHEVIEATHGADEMVELDAMNVTLSAAAVAVSEGKSQIDLPPELSEELVVDQRVYEAQTSLIKQLDHNHVAVKYDYGEDSGVWAEEDVVFLVEQQSPVVEPGVSSAEVEIGRAHV